MAPILGTTHMDEENEINFKKLIFWEFCVLGCALILVLILRWCFDLHEQKKKQTVEIQNIVNEVLDRHQGDKWELALGKYLDPDDIDLYNCNEMQKSVIVGRLSNCEYKSVENTNEILSHRSEYSLFLELSIVDNSGIEQVHVSVFIDKAPVDDIWYVQLQEKENVYLYKFTSNDNIEKFLRFPDDLGMYEKGI